MVHKAMESPVVTIGVLVHEAGDKVGGDSDDESLGDRITSTEDCSEWAASGRHRGRVNEGLPTLGHAIQRSYKG